MTPFLSDWEKNGAFVSAILGVHDIVSESVDRRAVFFAAERIHKPVDRLHRVILHVGIANAVYAFALHVGIRPVDAVRLRVVIGDEEHAVRAHAVVIIRGHLEIVAALNLF